MHMQYGAITVGVDATIDQKLRWIREKGMTVWQPSAPEFAGSAQDPVRVRETAEAMGIHLSALAAGVPMADPSKRQQCLEDWRSRVKLAQNLKVPTMFSRSFPLPEGTSAKEAWANCVYLCKEMTRICTDNGLHFAFETDHENFIDTLQDLLRLLDEVDSPDMKVNYDPCNFFIGGSNPPEVLDALFPRVVHGHIKDAVRDGAHAHEVPVGQGHLDWPAIFADLKNRGYNGAMVIEHCATFDQLDAAWKHIRPLID